MSRRKHNGNNDNFKRRSFKIAQANCMDKIKNTIMLFLPSLAISDAYCLPPAENKSPIRENSVAKALYNDGLIRNSPLGHSSRRNDEEGFNALWRPSVVTNSTIRHR
ncbi:uncharacterized protein CLUP02_06061 [Colletotrichum lupini]|uniref:Uncharacterized protein n=1 Tax=Colletotrichum lupini TaxID=145971 RepID=A0A9Q8SNL7_9PEZI|nr:uncharacterized protein CLUP02_06061 [Colletotrichum lupini]UQC80578.1 hypothetical protein CLUP02_06061 [Colletotrichum lupini]